MGEAAAQSGDPLLPDDPANNLGWLLGQVHHGYRAAATAAFSDLPGGMKGLFVLGAAVEGAARNQIEVARRFDIDRTVMVRLVDELERAGLVERRADPSDRRARTIAVTAAGRARYATVQHRFAAVDEHVLAPLSGTEREVFAALLRQVASRLVAADPTHGEAACRTEHIALSAETGENDRAGQPDGVARRAAPLGHAS